LPSLRVMTWNASNLTHGSRELALVNLLSSHRMDVMVVTETELPVLLAPSFKVLGYTAFLSPQSKYLDKHRVMTLVKSSLAVSANARRICEECELSRTDRISDDEPTQPSTQAVWVRLDLKDGISKRKTVVVGGAYREWGGSTKDQEEVVSAYGAQMLAATSAHPTRCCAG
jgi:exonuclease III